MTDDRHLQKDVLAELGWEPKVTAELIGVTARNGVVTLTGHVENYIEKNAAETAAGRVKGVKAVAEELEVHLRDLISVHSVRRSFSDQRIGERARRRSS
jgi:osmotically-inducible protein OsmY